MHALPRELRTERLVLRAWRGDDAAELRPVLLANQEHLRRWIPEHVYSAPPLAELVERLEDFAAKRKLHVRCSARPPRGERREPMIRLHDLPHVRLQDLH